MSIPPSNPNRPLVHGSESPNGPGQRSGDETQPVIPRGEHPPSQRSLAGRKASQTVPVPYSTSSPATLPPTNPEEAEKHFIQQRFRVEALETRTTLARFADSLSQHIASGNPDRAEAPLLIIHVGSNGKMTNIIPADEAIRDPQTSKTLRESLAKTFKEINEYYTPEKKAALQKDLAEAKKELVSSEQTLLDLQRPLPQPDLKGRGIPIDTSSLKKPPELSETFPPPRPNSHRPGTYAVSHDLSETDGRTEKIVFDNVSGKLKYPPSEEDPEPNLAAGSDPAIETLQFYQADFYQDSTAIRDFDSSGDKAILLRQGDPLEDEASVGAPLALLAGQKNHDCQGSDHSARKALLFPLLMNFMRKHRHPSANQFPKEATYAYQVGLAATLPNTAKVLEGYGSDTERERCQNLLTDLEDMHPAVAEIVARDVTGSQKTHPQVGDEKPGTAFYDALTASIIRDIERFEMARFENRMDVEDLEIYKKLRQSMSEEEWQSKVSDISLDLAQLCYCWIKGLKEQGEVTDDCQIYLQEKPLDFIDETRPSVGPNAVGAYSRQRDWMLSYEHLQSLYDWDGQDDFEDED